MAKAGTGKLWFYANHLYFVAILGFSFWFWLAVPFASHRETYWWLAMVQSRDFVDALSVISSTYRPLAQAATWSAYLLLEPDVFPTQHVNQLLLQCAVYILFLYSWWLLFSRSEQKRTLAVVSLISGLVFFSGYVHLFHLYGLFYAPVMLALGSLIMISSSPAQVSGRRECALGVIAMVLAFWHPFATALCIGGYAGHYLETFSLRTKRQHFGSLCILTSGLLCIAALAVVFQRDASIPPAARLHGFVTSYRVNEVHAVASAVAYLLTLAALMGMPVRMAAKAASALCFSLCTLLFVVSGLPVVLLWCGAVILKLMAMRSWRLLSLAVTAVLLPFGGGIGSPMYALFAIIVATYATSLGWAPTDKLLAFVNPRRTGSVLAIALTVVLAMRLGVTVPILSRFAKPLLAERERTYQLEQILAWLRTTRYCSHDIAFSEEAGNPADSAESVISRRTRPPAWIGDVRLFWDTILRCEMAREGSGPKNTVLITFNESDVPDATLIYSVGGTHAGQASVWAKLPAGPK